VRQLVQNFDSIKMHGMYVKIMDTVIFFRLTWIRNFRVICVLCHHPSKVVLCLQTALYCNVLYCTSIERGLKTHHHHLTWTLTQNTNPHKFKTNNFICILYFKIYCESYI